MEPWDVSSLIVILKFNFMWFSSVTQLCLTLCDPMNRSTPGLPVHHQLPELHSYSWRLSWWCHPTIPSSVIPFSSCPQSFPASGSFPMSGQAWSLSFSISPSNEYSGLIAFSSWCGTWCRNARKSLFLGVVEILEKAVTILSHASCVNTKHLTFSSKFRRELPWWFRHGFDLWSGN